MDIFYTVSVCTRINLPYHLSEIKIVIPDKLLMHSVGVSWLAITGSNPGSGISLAHLSRQAHKVNL